MSPGGSAAEAATATTGAPERLEGVSLNKETPAHAAASPRPSPVPALTSSIPTHSLELSDNILPKEAGKTVDMASVTATATLAAAGFDKRPTSAASSSLQTPGSGTFPSELLSPMVGSPGFIRREEALKTPITPPSAYLDFLKNMSPAIISPAPSSTSARFSFNDKFDLSSETTGLKRPRSPPTSQPVLLRNSSYDSNASDQSSDSQYSTTTTSSRKSRPESPRIIIPPSAFPSSGPRSSRTPRLHIPQSPFSPARGASQTAPSPYSQTPNSAAPWSASFSPRDYNFDANSQPGKVSVRHVVTRTVTYCRTPLEPAPKGKRRKLDTTSDPTPSAEEPPRKQEKIEASPEIKQEPVVSKA